MHVSTKLNIILRKITIDFKFKNHNFSTYFENTFLIVNYLKHSIKPKILLITFRF